MSRTTKSPPTEVVELKNMLNKYRTLSELFDGETNNEPNVKALMKLVEDFGKYLASRNVGLKTSQIRKFFDALKGIQKGLKGMEKELRNKGNNIKDLDLKAQQSIYRLKPALAYATGRHRKQLADFSDVVNIAIEKVKSKKDFDYLVEFVEYIVAFHKYYGGGD